MAETFLTPSQYDPARLLPPPPSDERFPEATKDELAELKAIEAARSAFQLARAKSDDKHRKCLHLCGNRWAGI